MAAVEWTPWGHKQHLQAKGQVLLSGIWWGQTTFTISSPNVQHFAYTRKYRVTYLLSLYGTLPAPPLPQSDDICKPAW